MLNLQIFDRSELWQLVNIFYKDYKNAWKPTAYRHEAYEIAKEIHQYLMN